MPKETGTRSAAMSDCEKVAPGSGMLVKTAEDTMPYNTITYGAAGSARETDITRQLALGLLSAMADDCSTKPSLTAPRWELG